MATIERLRIYPIKGFDPVDLDAVAVRPGGTLRHDREYALVRDGEVINAKASDRFHRLRTGFDPSTGTLTLDPPDGEGASFALPEETEAAGEWLGAFLDMDVRLERETDVGFVDRQSMGPSVISTATLRAVASWFDDLIVENVRRRLRANVEVAGVPAFWEDRFAGEDAPAFRAGGVRFEGATPCGRCIIPARDPETGETLEGFQKRFVERRRETFPEWADPDAFDHYYTLMLIASIPNGSRGRTLEIGDEVEIVE